MKHTIYLTLTIAMLAIHAGAQSKNSNWPWVRTDTQGFKWDINYNGTVNDGNSDAYDGGMSLRLSGNTIPNGSRPADVSKNNQELILNSQRWNSVQVTRRIYVDSEGAYCRWIDVFENTSDKSITLNVEYYTNLGSSIRTISSTSGNSAVLPADYGFVTSSSSSSRPAVVHLYASPISPLKPTVQMKTGSDSVFYRFKLVIPGKETKALCIFHMQRPNHSAGVTAMKEFSFGAALTKIPPEVGLFIANMPTDSIHLNGHPLLRRKDADQVTMRNQSIQLGTIQNKTFQLKGRTGEITIPASKVAGMLIPMAGDSLVMLALTDGQIVSGEWMNGPVTLLSKQDGKDIPKTIEIAELASAAWKVTADKPSDIPSASPALLMKDGQVLTFTGKSPEIVFLTEYGRVTADAKSLLSVDLVGGKGGMHTLAFRNGSKLPGLLVNETIDGNFQYGGAVKLQPDHIREIRFSDKPIDAFGLLKLTLQNGAILYGKLAEPIVVTQGTEDVSISNQQLKTLQRVKGTTSRVSARTNKGKHLSGTMKAIRLPFTIQPGPTLPLAVSHVNQISCVGAKPKPKPAPKPKAKVKTKPAPKPKPTSRPTVTHHHASTVITQPAADRREADARARAEKAQAVAEARKAKAMAAAKAAKDAAEKKAK
jgi:hypothetical protein